MLLLVQLLPPFCVLVTSQGRLILWSFVNQVTKGILYRVLQGMQALENDFRRICGYLFFIFPRILLMHLVPLPLNLFGICVYVNFFFYQSLLLFHLWFLLLSINDCSKHLWLLGCREGTLGWIWFSWINFFLGGLYRGWPWNVFACVQ